MRRHHLAQVMTFVRRVGVGEGPGGARGQAPVVAELLSDRSTHSSILATNGSMIRTRHSGDLERAVCVNDMSTDVPERR
jgi:hypothetical protein